MNFPISFFSSTSPQRENCQILYILSFLPQTINQVLHREWTDCFPVLNCITISALSSPFFFYGVLHQVFKQACAGGLIHLDCGCERGASSNLPSVSKVTALLSASCRPPTLPSTLHVPASSQPTDLHFHYQNWDYLHREAVWIDYFAL